MVSVTVAQHNTTDAQYLPCHCQTLGRVQSSEQVRAHAGPASDRHQVWESPGVLVHRQVLDRLCNEVAISRSKTKWGWSILPPLVRTGGGTKLKSLDMSFSGLMTLVERLVRYRTDPVTGRLLSQQERSAEEVVEEERRDLARGVMRAAFEHVASRVVLALKSSTAIAPHTNGEPENSKPPSLILSGGVASNTFLRHVIASTLCAHGFGDVELHFPTPKYCTDNAAMIGWTGLEMYENGHVDGLGIRALRKWPLDQLLDPVDDGKM